MFGRTVFGRTEEGRIESFTEVSSNMETPAALEMEQLEKELGEERAKNEQQRKELADKDKRITELQIELNEEKTRQHLKDIQIEQQNKQLTEKEERIKEVKKELEDQLSENDLTIKAQQKNINELDEKLSIKRSSDNKSENKQYSLILPSSDTNSTHSPSKRHPSVGKRHLLNMKAGDRTSMQNFQQSPAPQRNEKEKEKTLPSPPALNFENYPPMSPSNSHSSATPTTKNDASEASPSPAENSTASSVVESFPASSHPAASPLVVNTSPNSHLARNVPEKVIYYTDSNTHTLPQILKEKMNEIRSDSGKVPELEQVRAYTMQKAHKLVQTNNHENAIVVINLMTNNARRRESPASVCGLQEEIIRMLESETAPQNIVFIESPPSLKFDTVTYNKSTEALCKRMNVQFSRTLICKGHLNRDGYHVRFEHQHLMQRTVAAAILNVDPFKAFNLSPNSRGLLGPYSTS